MYDIRPLEYAEFEFLGQQKLFQEHYDEIAKNKSVMVIGMNTEKYLQAEKEGILFILGVFNGEEFVGYVTNFIFNHLHYKTVKVCNNDLIFVQKEHRKNKVGRMLIKQTEVMAKELGAKIVFWHAKQNTSLEKMMPEIGYNIQEIVFSKEI